MGYHLLNGEPIADAILDRIINSSYLITLHGKSLREAYFKLNKIRGMYILYGKNVIPLISLLNGLPSGLMIYKLMDLHSVFTELL